MTARPPLHCAAKMSIDDDEDRTLLFAFLKSEIKFCSPLACEAIVDVPAKITGVKESFVSAVTGRCGAVECRGKGRAWVSVHGLRVVARGSAGQSVRCIICASNRMFEITQAT